ncbi:hypothetical protein GCM10010324_05090 [Streptomyces hiroshimensis]|uniref:Uncharacterized protein n=2 Tax=Streptomyces hiroshimensis TaxID=66424 RepID=A0ABQ2Y4E6_9ACTN|nr:hypothetical protein GCM10010324_05090 [Streptomyces hiroshimensis]
MSDDAQGGGQPDGDGPFWKGAKKKVLAGIGAAVVAVIGFVVTQVGTDVKDKVFGEPTGIDVDVEQGSDCNSSGWIYPNSPDSERMNTPPGAGKRIQGMTWDQDPDAFGAVPAGPVKLHMAVTTKAVRSAVILKSLTFHLVEKKTPVEGTHVNLGRACGNGATYHYGVINFDKDAPYWVTRPALPSKERSDELKFPYKVTSTDPSVLLVTVIPSGYCKWDAKLEWTDGKTSGTYVINDHGHPFETAEIQKKVRSFEWVGGKRNEV